MRCFDSTQLVSHQRRHEECCLNSPTSHWCLPLPLAALWVLRSSVGCLYFAVRCPLKCLFRVTLLEVHARPNFPIPLAPN